MDFIRITVIDIIDIVVVAVIMYYIYKVMRGSSATSIIAGILLIYALGIVVRLLNMEMLSSIINSVTNVGIVALVVIFQPELRRFLQVLGTQSRTRQRSFLGRLFDSKSHAGLDATYVDPVVQACADMSQTKTGALIAIQMDGNLQEIIDSGVIIDARISTSLIKNVFFKNSPLHDGAMVIDNNRIMAAKCVLPSTKSEVPLSFGMRHRAAMGLSEVSDAIVVIVSEETGNISVAHNGKISIGLSSPELRTELLRISEERNQAAQTKKAAKAANANAA